MLMLMIIMLTTQNVNASMRTLSRYIIIHLIILG